MNTCFSPTAGFCGPNCSPFCIPGTDCFSGFAPYAQNTFPQNIWGGTGFNAQPFGQWNTPWTQNAYGVNSCGPVNGYGINGINSNGFGFNGFQGFNGVAPINGFNGYSPATGFGGCSPIASNWNTPWTNSVPCGGIPAWGMNTQGLNPVQNWGAPITGGMTSPWSMWNTPFAGTGLNGTTPFNCGASLGGIPFGGSVPFGGVPFGGSVPFGGMPFGGSVPFGGVPFNWSMPFNGVPFFGMPFAGMPGWQGAAPTTTGVKGTKKTEAEGVAANAACYPYGFTPFGPFGYFNPAAFCQPCETNRAA